MTRLRRHLLRVSMADVAWLAALIAVGVVVGLYVFAHQRLAWPSWVPGIGKQYFRFDAEFASAPGVLPGQGNAVTVAGVKVGEISGVGLKDGRALLKLRLDAKYRDVRPDATLLLRPKTGLKDMVVELDPGSRGAGPPLRAGSTLGIDATAPDVNFDEVLASLDGDTRDLLVSLLQNAGEGLSDGDGRPLGNVLRRFEPLSRHAADATRLVAERHARLKRLMGNLSLIAGELGRRDDQLARFVNGSEGSFRRFARQSSAITTTLRELPGTLATTGDALDDVTKLSTTLRTGLTALAPSAATLGPSLRLLRPFLTRTAPVIRDEIRPFTREAQPTARKLSPSIRDLAAATPKLTTLAGVLNAILDELAYDPPGDGVTGQSFLFDLPWANHDTNSVLSAQDGVGPTRRALVYYSCGALQLLKSLTEVPPRKTEPRNPTLATIIGLLNAPSFDDQVAQGHCRPSAR